MAIRVGIGGWSYAPWRGGFYPAGLKQAQELHFASRNLTAIEINATFYRTQTPQSFARWAAETPEGFMFAVKAPRAATYPTDPARQDAAIERFVDSGLAQLGSKLGPILWQFPATRRFEPAAMAHFLAALPAMLGTLRLRHVVEAVHASFADPAWVALLRQAGVARAIVDRDGAPLADVTAGFVYARLERNDAAAPEGYESGALTAWAGRLRLWAAGGAVGDLPRAAEASCGTAERDCFAFFISGDKQRAPEAAQALLGRLAAPGEPMPGEAVPGVAASRRSGDF